MSKAPSKRAKLKVVSVSMSETFVSEERTLRHIFSEVQESCLSHERLGEEFMQLHRELSCPAFWNELQICLLCTLAADEKAAQNVQNTFTFIGKQLALLANNHEDLLEKVVRVALSNLDCQSKLIRARSCALLGCILSQLGHHCSLSDTLFEDTQRAIMSVTRDKNLAVRIEAVKSVKRLQNVSDQRNCPAIRRLLTMARRDASADVRVAALQTVVLTSRTIECVVERCRDLAENVRACAADVLALKVNPKSLRLEARLHVLANLIGAAQSNAVVLAQDVNTSVQAHSTNFKLVLRVVSAWLAKCDASLLGFVRLFDVEHNAELLERVLDAFLQAESRGNTFERLVRDVRVCLDDSNHTILGDQLTVDSAFAIRVLCSFLHRRRGEIAKSTLLEKNQNVVNDEAPPVLNLEFLREGVSVTQIDEFLEQLQPSDVATFVTYFRSLLKEFERRTSDLVDPDSSDAPASRLTIREYGAQQFVLGQLLAIADTFDDTYIDESGRRQLLDLLYVDVLSCRPLVTNESVCRRAVCLARRLELVSNTPIGGYSTSRGGDASFVERLLHTISELRSPSHIAQGDTYASNGPDSDETPQQTRLNAVTRRNSTMISMLYAQLSDVRVETNDEHERIMHLVLQEDYHGVAEAKHRLEQLEARRVLIEKRICDLQRVEHANNSVARKNAGAVPLISMRINSPRPVNDDNLVDDSETLASCLLLFKCMLSELPPRRLTSSIMSSVIEFFRAFVVRCVPNRSEFVRRHAIACAALCGLAHAEIARRAMNAILLQAVVVDRVSIKPVALRAMFDFLCEYGFAFFSSNHVTRRTHDESVASSDADCVITGVTVNETTVAIESEDGLVDEDQPGDEVIDAQHHTPNNLLDLLKTFLVPEENDPLLIIAIEGFAKLFLARRLRSPAILSHLLLRWYDPSVNESNGLIARVMVNFWPIFALSSMRNQRQLSAAFVPTLSRLLNALPDSALSKIDSVNLYTLLINLTNSNHLSKAALAEMNAALNPRSLPGFVCEPHEIIARNLCEIIINESGVKHAPVYARVLEQLAVSVCHARINELREIDRLARRATQHIKDKAALRTITTFADKMHTTVVELERLAAERAKEDALSSVQKHHETSAFKRPMSVTKQVSNTSTVSVRKRLRCETASCSQSSESAPTPAATERVSNLADMTDAIGTLCIEQNSLSTSTPCRAEAAAAQRTGRSDARGSHRLFELDDTSAADNADDSMFSATTFHGEFGERMHEQNQSTIITERQSEGTK